MRILLVEDDALLGDGLRAGLQQSAFAVDWVRDGPSAEEALRTNPYAAAVLDLSLPGKDGLQVLASIRGANNPVPLLILTARDSLDDRLRGLDGGADDYLLKPFAMAELLARMRAVLRRKGGNALPVLGNGVVSLDLLSKQASTETQSGVTLSSREFALLLALLLRPGAILSRSELEDRLYGWGNEVESNAIEFLIHAVRRKLGSHIIKNVRGMGWMVSKNV